MIWNTIDDIALDGGCLCFDFINTRGTWKEEGKKDFFNDYFDLVKFLRRQNTFELSYLEKLGNLANSNYAKSLEVYTEFFELRGMLHKIFSSINKGVNVEPKTQEAFNRYLSEYGTSISLNFEKGTFKIGNVFQGNSLREPILLIIQSAKNVIEDYPNNKIKQCSECGWIFLDRTKNNRQKYCNPAICGTRVKMRNYYQRKKSKNAN